MANRLNVFLSGATGTLTLSPEPPSSGFYPVGEVVTVSIILDSGFTFTNWTINGVEQGTATSINITINFSDITLVANATGKPTDNFTYGLRLWDEFVDDQNRKNRIEIEEKNFTGTEERVTIKNPEYSIGTNDNYPDDIFITSKLAWDFQIEKGLPDLDFLLTLDPRRYRVKWYRNYTNPSTYDFIWVGYLKTEFLEREEFRSTYEISLVATDGISDFQGYLAPVTGLDFTNAATILTELLNASFKDIIPIRECIRVFENRMDVGDTYTLLEQFTVNPDCLFVDEVRFQQDGSFLIYNPSKNLTDALETILSSWICRVFQWNGYWYIVRVMEYLKPNLRLSTFNTSGVRTAQTNFTAKDSFACIGNLTRRGETGFTRFNTFLKLGSLNRPETREILRDEFGPQSWAESPFLTAKPLKNWDYINAIVFDGTRDGEVARVERYSGYDGVNTFPLFWGTADGISDANISGIKWRNETGTAAVKNADTITIQAKFAVYRRRTTDPTPVPFGTHSVGLQIKIGARYLSYDGLVTFTWTNTPTKIFFPANNLGEGVFNQISINEIVVDTDGQVELTLYQLVTLSGTRHRYVVAWDDVIINLSRNDALTYKEIKAKAETEITYSNEFQTRETFIGDALTPLSSSAIILDDGSVSETWERQGETESEPLLGLVLTDLVNLFGKNNYMIRAEIKESEAGKGIDFRKGLTYRNTPYVLTSASLDVRSSVWNIQAFQLEANPSNVVTITWEVIDTTSGVYIDANVGFFVNGDLLTFNLGAGTGSFDVQIGDLIKVVYFYYRPKYSGSPVDPRLDLLIDSVLIDSNPLDLNVSSEYEHTFVATNSAYNITVTSGHG
jgi:hypothetical protein